MLRLSKRAWNNVLIFSMLALILVLNLDKFTNDNNEAAKLIVAEGEYILSLQINQVQIEKAGTQWRISQAGVQPSVVPTASQLKNLVLAWQQAYVQAAKIDFTSEMFGSPDALISLNLAGNSEATVVALVIVNNEMFVVIDAQVYVLMSPNVEQLLSPIITVKQ